ncbi:hypothetical protein C7M84_018227 [Penaeus vannamei]|uniref:Uncharacterized protein n=1 Tax=Penaeus vannamei TaxID=6689 RepID=A0A423SHY0_PENVA|nr:hypothetical protein C7M84_018227 [Penaeus vannamei]
MNTIFRELHCAINTSRQEPRPVREERQPTSRPPPGAVPPSVRQGSCRTDGRPCLWSCWLRACAANYRERRRAPPLACCVAAAAAAARLPLGPFPRAAAWPERAGGAAACPARPFSLGGGEEIVGLGAAVAAAPPGLACQPHLPWLARGRLFPTPFPPPPSRAEGGRPWPGLNRGWLGLTPIGPWRPLGPRAVAWDSGVALPHPRRGLAPAGRARAALGAVVVAEGLRRQRQGDCLGCGRRGATPSSPLLLRPPSGPACPPAPAVQGPPAPGLAAWASFPLRPPRPLRPRAAGRWLDLPVSLPRLPRAGAGWAFPLRPPAPSRAVGSGVGDGRGPAGIAPRRGRFSLAGGRGRALGAVVGGHLRLQAGGRRAPRRARRRDRAGALRGRCGGPCWLGLAPCALSGRGGGGGRGPGVAPAAAKKPLPLRLPSPKAGQALGGPGCRGRRRGCLPWPPGPSGPCPRSCGLRARSPCLSGSRPRKRGRLWGSPGCRGRRRGCLPWPPGPSGPCPAVVWAESARADNYRVVHLHLGRWAGLERGEAGAGPPRGRSRPASVAGGARGGAAGLAVGARCSPPSTREKVRLYRGVGGGACGGRPLPWRGAGGAPVCGRVG